MSNETTTPHTTHEHGKGPSAEGSGAAIRQSVLLSLALTIGVLSVVALGAWLHRDALLAAVLPAMGTGYDQAMNAGGLSADEARLAQSGTDEATIVSTVERVNPAVVSVIVTRDVPVIERYFEEVQPFGDGFGTFRVPRQRQEGTQEREVGGGSGFFVSADGLIVTNRHVVADQEANYSVLTNDGESLEAEVLARDDVLDIAVLDVGGSGHTYLTFADSDALRPGQTAIAIGNALGEFRNSVSVGVVSGLSRSIVAGGMGMREQLDEVIQTDAAINPGNSGGPLLDSSGRVIGVNVATSFGAENIGFALPGNAVADIVQSVEQYGEIQRPFLGVRYLSINERIAEANDLPVAYGALVVRGESSEALAVMPGSPADAAGIEENDIILSINNTSLEERSLASVIRGLSVGQTVPVRLLHDGEERVVSVTLEEAPE